MPIHCTVKRSEEAPTPLTTGSSHRKKAQFSLKAVSKAERTKNVGAKSAKCLNH